MQLGTDLLSEKHDDLIPFRNGDFVSSAITATDHKYYDSSTGLPLAEDRIDEAKKYQESVEYKLGLSDKVVNGDLLRFYTPKNFKAVDPTQFDYTNPEHKKSEE